METKMAEKTPAAVIINSIEDDSLSHASKSLLSGTSKRINSSVESYIAKQFGRPRFHWVRDKPDSRDYVYKSTTPPKSTALIDLRKFCTPIENQGSLGSCTGQAIAGAIELLNKKNGIVYDASRLFIYYYERFMMGTVNFDSGAYIRDGIKVVYTYGAALETLWPYVISKFRQRPTTAAINDALNRRVTLYERATNFDACINALANGYPVIVGFYVYSSFMSRQVAATGIMPYPNTRRESFMGGHAVLLVGYNHSEQTFIARNSWGARWGDRGYFYMPYQVIKNPAMSSDFWVIKSINNPLATT